MPLGLLLLVATIQGLTEFLPVSSSGHLVLIPMVTDFPYQGRTIDVAAHVGTLLAVALYLRRDIAAITLALIGYAMRRGQHSPNSSQNTAHAKPSGHDTTTAALGLMLILATIPVMFAGYVVNYAAITWLTMLVTLALSNLFFAGLLWFADKAPIRHDGLEQLRWKAALIIGLAQICALIPGASRSGVTMSAARFLGFDRISAARFSLLLSLPVIAGAGALKIYDLIKTGDASLGSDAVIVAVLSAGLAWLAIGWMMRWLAHASFGIFVCYRLLLGGFLLLALASGWLPASLG